MKSLFDLTQFSGIKLKNRFFRSATYDGLADERGHMTEELFQVYENLAKGGVGTIITGLTTVTDIEQAIPRQMAIYDDSFIDGYKKLTEMSHRYHANIILQLACLGSQTSSGKVVWGPSSVEETGGQVYCFGGKVLNSFEVISNIRQKLGEQGDRAGRSIRYSGAS